MMTGVVLRRRGINGTRCAETLTSGSDHRPACNDEREERGDQPGDH